METPLFTKFLAKENYWYSFPWWEYPLAISVLVGSKARPLSRGNRNCFLMMGLNAMAPTPRKHWPKYTPRKIKKPKEQVVVDSARRKKTPLFLCWTPDLGGLFTKDTTQHPSRFAGCCLGAGAYNSHDFEPKQRAANFKYSNKLPLAEAKAGELEEAKDWHPEICQSVEGILQGEGGGYVIPAVTSPPFETRRKKKAFGRN